jgi:hypothetical protein
MKKYFPDDGCEMYHDGAEPWDTTTAPLGPFYLASEVDEMVAELLGASLGAAMGLRLFGAQEAAKEIEAITKPYIHLIK